MADLRILEILAHQLGKAIRQGQRAIEKTNGKGAYRHVFAACDSVPAMVTQARKEPGYCPPAEQGKCAVVATGDTDEFLKAAGAMPACKLSAADIADLVEDRLGCIRPVLLEEIKFALGMSTAPILHPQVLRRNVAAHARGTTAALRISTLNGTGWSSGVRRQLAKQSAVYEK